MCKIVSLWFIYWEWYIVRGRFKRQKIWITLIFPECWLEMWCTWTSWNQISTIDVGYLLWECYFFSLIYVWIHFIVLSARCFMDLSDQGDYLKATRGVTFIITSVVRGARCFGSGLTSSSAVRLCVWFPTHKFGMASEPITPLLTHHPLWGNERAGLLIHHLSTYLPTALCIIIGSLA